MKKLENVSDETEKIFDRIRNSTSIPQWVEFKVYSDAKQKQLYKISKFNDFAYKYVEEHLKEHIDIQIIINEPIFEKLTEQQRELAFVECLTGVSVSDADLVSLKKPTVNTYFGVLAKYSNDVVITLHESIKSLFDQLKEEEDREKAEIGEKNKKKKF